MAQHENTTPLAPTPISINLATEAQYVEKNPSLEGTSEANCRPLKVTALFKIA